jgi:hypothetical protein
MEDGTPGEALLLLTWPLAIILAVVALVWLCFPRTRRAAWWLIGLILIGLVVAHLAGAVSGRRRERIRSEPATAPYSEPATRSPQG